MILALTLLAFQAASPRPPRRNSPPATISSDTSGTRSSNPARSGPITPAQPTSAQLSPFPKSTTSLAPALSSTSSSTTSTTNSTSHPRLRNRVSLPSESEQFVINRDSLDASVTELLDNVRIPDPGQFRLLARPLPRRNPRHHRRGYAHRPRPKRFEQQLSDRAAEAAASNPLPCEASTQRQETITPLPPRCLQPPLPPHLTPMPPRPHPSKPRRPAPSVYRHTPQIRVPHSSQSHRDGWVIAQHATAFAARPTTSSF